MASLAGSVDILALFQPEAHGVAPVGIVEGIGFGKEGFTIGIDERHFSREAVYYDRHFRCRGRELFR